MATLYMSTYANDLTIHKSQIYKPCEAVERISEIMFKPEVYYTDYKQRLKAQRMDVFGVIDLKIRCVRKQGSRSKRGYEIRIKLTSDSAKITKFEKIKHNTIATHYCFSIGEVLYYLWKL